MNRPLAARDFAPDFRARFSADEFVEMVRLGAFAGMRVELLNGELERMTPPMSDHARVQMDIVFSLHGLLREVPGVEVFGEVGVRLSDASVIGTDAAIVRPRNRENRMFDADEIVLAVEVSNSTLSRDLGMKRMAYAEAGVPDYWVVDIARRLVHRFTQPTDGDYLALDTLRFGDPIPVPGTDGSITLD